MSETEAVKEKRRTFMDAHPTRGAYILDGGSPIWKAPVTMNGEPSTFAKAYHKLKDSKIVKMPDGPNVPMREEYMLEDGKIELKGEMEVLWAIQGLAELTRRGIDPFRVTWYYYDHDQVVDFVQYSYKFFCVADNRIVEEAWSIDGNVPLILRRDDSEPIWQSHVYFQQALEPYWYRRFYSETLTGQLMVLRPDEPTLYYYERPGARDVVRDLNFVTLQQIYRLLLVAVALLGAIALPSLRLYLGLGAAAFGADYLWLCWRARKVGSP